MSNRLLALHNYAKRKHDVLTHRACSVIVLGKDRYLAVVSLPGPLISIAILITRTSRRMQGIVGQACMSSHLQLGIHNKVIILLLFYRYYYTAITSPLYMENRCTSQIDVHLLAM